MNGTIPPVARSSHAMPNRVHDPVYWHDRAAETRALAQRVTDPSVKRILLGVAEQYDEIAEMVTQRLIAPAKEKSK